MQRLLIALMAIGSFLMTNPVALRAQDDSKAVDPARGPQAIDEPVAASHIMAGPAPTSAAHQAKSVSPNHKVRRLPDEYPAISHVSAHVSGAAHPLQGARKQQSWFGSQLALLILGLLGAGLAVIVTPNAAKRVADHVSSSPRRDLRIGAFVGIGFLAVLMANAILLKLPLIKILWAPIGLMVAFAPLLVLGFGWLAAMRFAGDCVARKLNRSGEGSTLSRMTLGLFAFFIVNVLLGSISHGLGVIGLCVEVAVALMGLGATAVIAAGSGFGRRA